MALNLTELYVFNQKKLLINTYQTVLKPKLIFLFWKMINNADSARIINLLNTVSYWWYYLHIIYRADYKNPTLTYLNCQS